MRNKYGRRERQGKQYEGRMKGRNGTGGGKVQHIITINWKSPGNMNTQLVSV